MRVWILGHPRSGTGYVAALFRQAGWDVGHEFVREDGIASWMWAVDSEKVPWGDARNGAERPEHMIHVMRKPAAAVASIAYTEGDSELWRSKQIWLPPAPASLIERAVFSLLNWNLLIQAQAPTRVVQLEHVEAFVTQLTGEKVEASERVNVRRHKKLTAAEIEEALGEYGTDAWYRANLMWGEAE
jgi:hypothetical protein